MNSTAIQSYVYIGGREASSEHLIMEKDNWFLFTA